MKFPKQESRKVMLSYEIKNSVTIIIKYCPTDMNSGSLEWGTKYELRPFCEPI